MSKMFFTQSLCILLERPVSLDEIEAVIGDFEIRARRDFSDTWEFGGPSLTIAYQPEINGLVVVDTVDVRWPDGMGDTKQEGSLFGAWSMGHFGPFTFPGGLKRAGLHSLVWDLGKEIAERHHAFIRIRSSYILGAADDDRLVIPPNYQALPELEFVTQVASSLLDLPAALCYFNPNGEVLLNQDSLRESLNFGWKHDLPPLEVWSNIRLFRVNEEWCLMDTVGNQQLDISDSEACFQSEFFDCGKVDNFLRNISLYLLDKGDVIKEGDTMDGPGGIRWQAWHCKNGICDPPRPVLRWFPLDDRAVPPELLPKDDPELE